MFVIQVMKCHALRGTFRMPWGGGSQFKRVDSLTSYVCQNIPRHVLEATYGINIIKPREDEDPHRPPTSEELLTAYGCKLGFIRKREQK